MERRKREGKRLNGEVQGEGVILAAGKEKGNERKGRQTCMRVSSSSQKAEKRVTGDKGGGGRWSVPEALQKKSKDLNGRNGNN